MRKAVEVVLISDLVVVVLYQRHRTICRKYAGTSSKHVIEDVLRTMKLGRTPEFKLETRMDENGKWIGSYPRIVV